MAAFSPPSNNGRDGPSSPPHCPLSFRSCFFPHLESPYPPRARPNIIRKSFFKSSLQLSQAQSGRVGRLPPSLPVEDRPHPAGQPMMCGGAGVGGGGGLQLPPLPVQVALAWTMWLCGDFPSHLASEVSKNFRVWGQPYKRQSQGHT